MRKFLCLLLTLGFLVPCIGSVFAESALNPASDYVELRVYTCVVTNGGLGAAASAGVDSAVGGCSRDEAGPKFGWAIPVSSIRAASSKIVGWSIQTNSVKADGTVVGVQASLHDIGSVTTDHAAAEAAMTNLTLFAEAEATATDPTFQMWFPYPKKLTTQLGVFVQANTDAVVSIYYIR